jgi:hypothetical protein
LQVDLDPEVIGTYASRYHRLDLWAQAARDLREGDTCTGSQLVPDRRVLRRSEFFNGFLRPFGAIDVMSCICSKENANGLFLGVVGYSLEEVAGQHHSMFVEPDYKASAEYREFWAASNRGETLRTEVGNFLENVRRM